MSRLFAGGATTDRVAATITAHNADAWTFGTWIYPTADTDLRRIIHRHRHVRATDVLV